MRVNQTLGGAAASAAPASKKRSEPMFWMVWGLPLASILISGSMSVIAVKYADPVLPNYHNSSDDEEGEVSKTPTTATIAAEQARNHAAHLVDAPDYKRQHR